MTERIRLSIRIKCLLYGHFWQSWQNWEDFQPIGYVCIRKGWATQWRARRCNRCLLIQEKMIDDAVNR